MSFVTTAPLNQGQKDAEAGFLQFLFDDQKEMILSGPGGYGKTHLVNHLISTTIPHYFDTCTIMGMEPTYKEVVVTATTNKAASVLMTATQLPSQTIQSYINLTVIPDFNTGISKLKKTNRFEIKYNKVAFIDECSFIDGKLDNFIGEAFHDSKIIYVGDHCQMAPVGEKISPIYRKGLRFYELTEPMRNAEQPALMALCNQLRETVETGKFKPIKIIPGVIDHVDNQQLDNELKANFSQQTTEFRCLAFTNNRVRQYNDHIRTIRGLPDEFTVGEIVVNNNALKLANGGVLGVDREVMIKKIDPVSKVTLSPNVEMEYIPLEVTCLNSLVDYSIKMPADFNHWEQLKKYYAKQKAWTEHYLLKDNYADLRPHDACTIYKAQGSTYNTVYIDLTDISSCRIADQVARMLYVGVSRVRSRVVLYGTLDSKYGGLTF